MCFDSCTITVKSFIDKPVKFRFDTLNNFKVNQISLKLSRDLEPKFQIYS